MELARQPLAHLPTPLESMDRLGAALGFAPGCLWVKRDDCTGLAGGGNKARKLEYLCAEALAAGCDTLVTGGGRQSNHVRITAAAANRLGLACTIVLAGRESARPTGNVVLDHVLGPEMVWVDAGGYYEIETAVEAAAARAEANGARPYVIPIGGASTTGAAAYVAATDELVDQLAGARPDLVVVADGSGGTHAGLVAGLGDHARVLGVDAGTRPDLDDQVPAMAAAVADRLGRPVPVGDCRIDHDRFGPGYGAPTDECREAIDLTARLEGLILDPVYSGKAMAGLIAARRSGRIAADTLTVFLHTGGLPGLFAATYADWVASPPATP